MREPRRIWLTLEGPEIIEMKQVILDRDVAGAVAFFRRVVAPRVVEVARRCGIPLSGREDTEDGGRLPG